MTAPHVALATSQRRAIVGAVDIVADHRTLVSHAATAPVDASALERDARTDENFDLIFAAQKTRLYAIAYSVLRDRGDAEDAVQETMWKAWKNWSSLRDPSKRDAWLTRICLNHCFRSKNKLARVKVTGGDDSAGDLDGPWASATPVMRASSAAGPRPSDLDLDDAFAALPLKQRAAVLLHYHYGYTIEQCGELMGCRSGTVRTHVQRALARLREELGDE